MEDLPLGRISALVPEFTAKDLPLDRTLMMIYNTIAYILLHIVAFDIKALVVPWHQFVYTLVIPCGRLVTQSGHDSILQLYFST